MIAKEGLPSLQWPISPRRALVASILGTMKGR